MNPVLEFLQYGIGGRYRGGKIKLKNPAFCSSLLDFLPTKHESRIQKAIFGAGSLAPLGSHFSEVAGANPAPGVF
jgi:hypothetical protein